MDGEGQDSRYFFHDFQRLYCIKLLTAASIVLAAGLQAALFFKAAATEKDWCLFLVPCADGALGWFSVVDRFVSGFLDVVAGACSAAEKDGRPNQPSESHSFPEANKAFSGPGRRRFLCGVFFYLLFIVWQRLPIKRLGPCAFICKSNLNFSYSAIV